MPILASICPLCLLLLFFGFTLLFHRVPSALWFTTPYWVTGWAICIHTVSEQCKDSDASDPCLQAGERSHLVQMSFQTWLNKANYLKKLNLVQLNRAKHLPCEHAHK